MHGPLNVKRIVCCRLRYPLHTHNGQQAPSVADEGQGLGPWHFAVGPSRSKLIVQWTNCVDCCQLLVMR